MRSVLLILVMLCIFSAPSIAAKCTINEDMVFVIDGKKVFPIGFTMPPPPEGSYGLHVNFFPLFQSSL